MSAQKILTLLLPVILAMLAMSCQETGVRPDDPGKDWRAITWEVDTITYPGSFQTAMRSIYATGPDNVYIVGHNDQPGPPTMFRYDGEQWKTTGFHVNEGGTVSGAVSLSAITGFGPDKIWAVGERIFNRPDPQSPFPDSSLILYFNGMQWVEQLIEGGPGRRLQSVWGSSPTDIWAAGMNTVLHYDGVSWEHFQIELPAQGIQFLSIAGLSASEAYMVGSRKDVQAPTDTVADLLYFFDGIKWAVVDSSIQTSPSFSPKFGVHLQVIENTLYSVYPAVFKQVGKTWQVFFSSSIPFGDVSGEKNTGIFAVGGSAKVYHYNGIDWFAIHERTNTGVNLLSVWNDADAVIAVGNDGFQTTVLRGR